MNRTEKLHKLYSELSVIETALKEFVVPRSADYPMEWMQEEVEKHGFLIKQRNDIIGEITQLESTNA
jgi:hypothetical protein